MLKPSDLENLKKNLEVKTFKKGQVIFPQGQIADGAYVVISGLVHIKKKHNLENFIEHLGDIGPGDSFGAWYALFESKLRPISAVAVVKTELVFIPNEVLIKKLQSCDPFIIYCFRKWIDLVRHEKVPSPKSNKIKGINDPKF